MEPHSRIVCRYFSTKGECFYGSDCQYLHQSPQHRPSDSPLAPESKLLSRWLPQDMSGSSNNGLDGKVSGKYTPRCSSAAAAYPPAPFTMNNVNSVPRFTGQATHMTQLPAAAASHFASDDIREQLLQRQALSLALPLLDADVPLRVENYQDLCPLEQVYGHHSKSLSGLITSVFKATDMRSGEVVCLHRVHNFAPSAGMLKGLLQVVDVWKKVTCSNIVPLRHVFLTKDFGDTSLVFVYEYFPGAKTMSSQYFSSAASSSLNGGGAGFNQARPYSQQQTKLIPESLIWSYIIQLSSALRVIHSNGLSCRSFDASKILLTSGCLPDPQYITNQALMQQVKNQPRLRLSCSGMMDFVMFDATASQKAVVVAQQQEDLLSFGKLCLSLACNSNQVADPGKWQQSLELVNRQYTPDLRSLICHLLSAKPGTGRVITINDIMPMIGARFYAQLDLSNQRFDHVERELSKELDNSRLFRLLCKLGCINERPEHKMDPQWSETGDRYLVKLFRDYLMYQVSEEGRPLLDLSHIVSSLNLLEQASPEKVCLLSRDEQNVLIVSYAELKKCFDSSFGDLFPADPQH
jgi:PAB-dependent poly(A)-specific ribonuclease subunit 3